MATNEQTLGSDGAQRSRAATFVGVMAALAGLAAVNSYRARRAERDNPPTGRFLNIGGVRLHNIDKGHGAPVVLLHGNLVAANDFAHCGLLDLLSERYRVLAFDRPGMGYSDRPRGKRWTPQEQAEHLRRAFALLGIERPVVVGHSWGAMVAMALGLDHPQAVKGLVLLGGYFYPTTRLDIGLATPPAIPVVGDLLCYTLSPLAGSAAMPALIKTMFAPRPVPDRFTANFAPGMALRPWQIRAMSQDGAMMASAAAKMQDRYRDLSMPVVIMAGDEDKVVDIGRQSRRLHREVPQSSLRLVPNAGHMVHYAVPREVSAAIEAIGGRSGP